MTNQEKNNLEKAKELLIQINNLRRKMNEEPLDFGEKLLDNFKNLPGILETTQDKMRALEGSATDLYQRLRAATSEIKNQVKPLTEIRRSYRNLTDDVNKLRQDELGITKLSLKELNNIKKRVDLNQNIIKLKSKELLESKGKNDAEIKALADINKAIQQRTKGDKTLADLGQVAKNNLLDIIINTKGLSDEQRALIATYVSEADLQEKIGKTVKDRVEDEKEIVAMYNSFSVAEKAVKEIPFLGKLISGPFEKATAAAKKAADSGLDAAKVSAEGMKAFGEGIGDIFNTSLGRLTLVISALKAAVNLFFKVDKISTQLGKSMALSTEEANNFRQELYQAGRDSKDIVVRLDTLANSQLALAKSAGVTRGFRMDELHATTLLVKRMGMQEESASRLADLSRINGMNSEEALDSIISSTQALMKQEDIQFSIADVTEEVAKTSGQLAATLKNNPALIGKAVVEARRLGLQLSQTKDIAKGLLDFESSITQELEAELLIGKQLNFEKARELALRGNFLGATKEIVRQVGTLEDFQNMNVIAQEGLAKAANMSVDEFADMLQQQKNLSVLSKQTREDIEARAAKLREEGKVEEANNLIRRSGSEEAAKASLMRLDAEQAFAEAVAKVKDVFVGMANALPLIIGGLTAIAVIMAAMAVSSIVATGGIAGLTSAAVVAGFLGLMAGFGVNAAAKSGGGGASSVSGKSGSSIDKDKYASLSGSGTNEVKLNDFTIRANPKDTLVMAGGTKLGDETNTLLKELISTVNKKAIIDIDEQAFISNAISYSTK